MTKTIDPAVSEYMAKLGAKGGTTRGAAKKRSKAHYIKAGKASGAARRKKAKARVI